MLFRSHLVKARAEKVVMAIKAYRIQHQRYPKTLEDLVPGHLDHIPLAHPMALTQKAFVYLNRVEDAAVPTRAPLFFYILVAPFGWMLYDFDTDTWVFRD